MRVVALVAAVYLSVSTIAVAANAGVGKALPTNFPPETLQVALQTLAKERGLQIVYRADLVRGLKTAGIHGNWTTEQTLDLLLKGTGLTYTYLGRKAVTIIPAAAPGVTNEDKADPRAETQHGKANGTPDKALHKAATDEATHSGAIAANDMLFGPSTEDTLQTITVTAQRYAQSQQNVPISMTVFSGRQLRQLHIDSLRSLSNVVPSLEVQSSQYQPIIMIRGVGNFFGSGATVGEYIDEADVTPNVFFKGMGLPTIETYDLKRVEVLRGPQGTLFGEGSLGGTVRFITNPPDLNGFGGYADLRDSVTQGGAPSERVVAVVNSPLDSHVFAIRVATDFEHDGGFLDQPAAGRKNYNSTNMDDTRIEARWHPMGNFNVNLMEIIHRSAFGYNGEGASMQKGIYTQVFNLGTTPNGRESYNVSNIEATYDLKRLQLLSTTTYVSSHLNMTNLGGIEQVSGPASVVPPYDYLFNPWLDTNKSFSEDFRLTSRGSRVLHWLVGAYYKHNSDQNSDHLWYALPGPPGTTLPSVSYASNQYVLSRSSSVYGDINYKIVPRLTVGAGLRYFRDNENYDNFVAGTSQTATFNSTDPRAYVKFKASRHVNVYASAAKGFRSGGFNIPGVPPYGPEDVWAYELGTKMRLLHGRLVANFDTFLTNYSNIVQLVFFPKYATNVFINGGRIRIKGAEASIKWIPARGWLLRAAGDYLNGRYVSVQGEMVPVAVGDPIQVAPRYQFSLFARRDFMVGSRLGFAQIEYSQRARSNTRNRSTGPWYYSQSDYMYLLGAEFGVHLTHSTDLDVFGRNLLNEHGYIDSDVIEGNSPQTRPRTVGVGIRMSF